MLWKLICCVLLMQFVASITVPKVMIPVGCTVACPPQKDPKHYICGRQLKTGLLGMFGGECFLGRYNHCVHVEQREYSLIMLINVN